MKIDQKNIPFSLARSGQAIEVDNSVSIKVLNPSEPLISGTTSDLNENSIVLLIKYGSVSFLLTGDAGFYAEGRIINSLEHIDILKVGHHGSAYATSNGLLNKINPEVAIISVGSNNNYGHPTPETLNRLTQHNVEVYRTDEYGTMKITTDGRTYRISTELSEIIPTPPTYYATTPTPQVVTPTATPMKTTLGFEAILVVLSIGIVIIAKRVKREERIKCENSNY